MQVIDVTGAVAGRVAAINACCIEVYHRGEMACLLSLVVFDITRKTVVLTCAEEDFSLHRCEHH